MAYYALKVKDGSGNIQTVGDPRTQDKADIASPALTGTPTAPTAAPGTNTTQIATTEFVGTAVSNLIDGAPGALDTLNELAAALGDDANYASTLTNELALKAPLASPSLTGTPTAPTAAGGTNTTQIATTEFVTSAISAAAPGEGSITSTMIANGTITNDDISASAAIDQSKIAGLTTSLAAKPDLFVAASTPGSLGAGDFWLDTSATI